MARTSQNCSFLAQELTTDYPARSVYIIDTDIQIPHSLKEIEAFDGRIV